MWRRVDKRSVIHHVGLRGGWRCAYPPYLIFEGNGSERLTKVSHRPHQESGFSIVAITKFERR